MSDLSNLSSCPNENELPDTELHSNFDTSMENRLIDENGFDRSMDFRDYCLLLNDRVKKMETQNSQMIRLAEKQKNEYNKVAAQVVYSEMMQRELQIECLNLRRQVKQLHSYNQQLVKNQAQNKDNESLNSISATISQNENISEKEGSYINLHSSVRQQKELSTSSIDEIAGREEVSTDERLHQYVATKNDVVCDNSTSDDYELPADICANKPSELSSFRNVSDNKPLVPQGEEESSKLGKKSKLGFKSEDRSFDNNSYLEVELKSFKQPHNNSPSINQISNFRRGSSFRRSYSCHSDINHKAIVKQRPLSFISDGDNTVKILEENNGKNELTVPNSEQQNNNLHSKFTVSQCQAEEPTKVNFPKETGLSNGSHSAIGRKPYYKRSSLNDLPPPPIPPPQSDLSEMCDVPEASKQEYFSKDKVTSDSEKKKCEKEELQHCNKLKSLGWRRKSYTAACHKSQSLDHLYDHHKKNHFSTLQNSRKFKFDNAPTPKENTFCNNIDDPSLEKENDDFPPPPPPYMLLQHNNLLDNNYNHDYTCMKPLPNYEIATGPSPKLPERKLVAKSSKNQNELNETILIRKNVNAKSTDFQNGSHMRRKSERIETNSQLPTRRYRSVSDDIPSKRMGGDQKVYKIQPAGLNSLPQPKTSPANNKSNQSTNFSSNDFRNQKPTKSVETKNLLKKGSGKHREVRTKPLIKTTNAAVLNENENASLKSGKPVKEDSLSNDKKKHNLKSQDGAHKPSFVNIMKAKFTRPSSGSRLLSSNKKMAKLNGKNKSNELLKETSVESTRSNIDPRTLSLNPNTYLSIEKASENRKASKKLLGKNSDFVVGRKLSQSTTKPATCNSTRKQIAEENVYENFCPIDHAKQTSVGQGSKSTSKYSITKNDFKNTPSRLQRPTSLKNIINNKSADTSSHKMSIQDQSPKDDISSTSSTGRADNEVSKINYADHQKMIESDFISSVVEAELGGKTNSRSSLFDARKPEITIPQLNSENTITEFVGTGSSFSSLPSDSLDNSYSVIDCKDVMLSKSFHNHVKPTRKKNQNTYDNVSPLRYSGIKCSNISSSSSETSNLERSKIPGSTAMRREFIDSKLSPQNYQRSKLDSNQSSSDFKPSNKINLKIEKNKNTHLTTLNPDIPQESIALSSQAETFSVSKSYPKAMLSINTSPTNERRPFSKKRLAPLNYSRLRPSHATKSKGIPSEPIYENASAILHQKQCLLD